MSDAGEGTKGIERFWAAWPDLRPQLDAAIAAKDYGDLPDRITALVQAIHPRLEWELGKGEEAEHGFTVSAAGITAHRHLSEAWRDDAPAADATWEFHSARRPQRGWTMEIGGVSVDAADVRVELEIDESTERVHVGLHHPSFSEVSEDLMGTITFLTLDHWLGEDAVERWLGGITPMRRLPDRGARGLETLDRMLRWLEAEATGERWAMMRGTIDGAETFAVVNRALKPIEHLGKTLRVEMVLGFVETNDAGFPTRAEAERLDALEDAMLAVDGYAHFGRFTIAGERRVVGYVRPELAEPGGALRARFEAARERHPQRVQRLETFDDPGWEKLRAFR